MEQLASLRCLVVLLLLPGIVPGLPVRLGWLKANLSVNVTIFAGTFSVNEQKLSVSGLSSGGYFAVQFHIAFSKLIMGAGIVAGGKLYTAVM